MFLSASVKCPHNISEALGSKSNNVLISIGSIRLEDKVHSNLDFCTLDRAEN